MILGMSLTPHALVLLNVQRYLLEDHPQEREIAREWVHEVDQARSRGDLIVFIQWDGEADTEHTTFSRGWTLHADFRAEAGDLLLRAVRPDAFRTSNLDAELKARAVRELRFLALNGSEEQSSMTGRARELGYAVQEAVAVA